MLWQDSPLDPGESLERIKLSAVGVVEATVEPSAESCGDGCSTSEPKDPSQEDAKKVDTVVSDGSTCHIERVEEAADRGCGTRPDNNVWHDNETRPITHKTEWLNKLPKKLVGAAKKTPMKTGARSRVQMELKSRKRTRLFSEPER